MSAQDIIDFPDWRRRLATRKNGEAYGDERNVLIAINEAPELKNMLRYDELRDRIEFDERCPWRKDCAGNSWADEDRIELQAWLQERKIPVLRGNCVQDCVVVTAKRRAVNPLLDRLNALTWDGRSRINSWLMNYLGAQGNEAYLAAVGRAFLIAAVARAYQPGCKVDTVLVLESPQGKGKSTVVSVLSYGFSTDSLPDMHSVNGSMHIQGTWINELPELAAIGRSDQEGVKAFLSRTVDRYRPPYGRNVIDRPRRCAFVGTTNLNEWMVDDTGGRRFWPVRCRGIELAKLEADRDQLWAEAIDAYYQSEPWHLSAKVEALATEAQEMRHLHSEQELAVLEYLDYCISTGKLVVYMKDLLTGPGGIDDLRKHGREAGGIARGFSRILAKAGWERLKPVGRGSDRRQPYEYQGKLPEKIAQADNSQAHKQTQELKLPDILKN